MINTIFSHFVTGTLLVSSLFGGTPATSQPVAFTKTLPVNNVIAHTVQKPETLEHIAKTYYGDASYWKTIWNDNPTISDPNDLSIGTMITLRTVKPATPDETVTALLSDEKTPSEPVAIASKTEAPTPTVSQPVMPTTAPTAVAKTPPSSYEEVYKEAGAKYGVPWQILYGLHITETGGRDGMIMNGSGSGARGPMQFMPGTWNAYGVDGDGDGVANIDNAVDAIHGAANFLAKHGSLDAGLRSYGGNTAGTLSLAREKGYSE